MSGRHRVVDLWQQIDTGERSLMVALCPNLDPMIPIPERVWVRCSWDAASGEYRGQQIS